MPTEYYKLEHTGPEIDSLLSEISTLRGQTNNNTTTTNTLSSKINTLESTVSGLSTSVNGMKATIYPVGSVVCIATNTNPSKWFGGTWELIDKEFTPYTSPEGDVSGFKKDDTNTKSVELCSIERAGHNIHIRTQLTTRKTISDEDKFNFGTYNLAVLGVNKLKVFSTSWMTDAGNSMIAINFHENGELHAVDVIPRNSSSSLGAQSFSAFSVVLTCAPSTMLDAACNKFYFKRTA